MKLKVGITGQNGFIGAHLYNYLSLKDNIELIPFEKGFFEDVNLLNSFVLKCDTIVHLAGVNRDNSQEYIFNKNVELADKLIESCVTAQVKPHIIFSSSTQEENNNPYGNAKRRCRENIEAWANQNNAKISSLIIPNVFGPFGKPNYNSVVATFCHKITRGEKPVIIQDNTIDLVYVNELIDDIYQEIVSPQEGIIEIKARHQVKVSVLLEMLYQFYDQYIQQGEFPCLTDAFSLALFNTFRCYIPYEHYPVKFKKNTDERGTFIEITRANSGGQTSYSTTKAGITRGNHFHTRKAERFAVIQGKAKISLRKIDSTEVIDYILEGDEPAFVDMPIWYTHSITNIGTEELLTLFWINEPYNPQDPDTYFINVSL